VRIVLPVIVAVALAVYALIDCAQAERHRLRSLSKPLWLVIIVLIPVLGPVAWMLLGRPHAGGSAGPRPAPRPRPVAPDDDPDFLRRLNAAGPPLQPKPPRPRDKDRSGDDRAADASDAAGPKPEDTEPEGREDGDPADRRHGPEIDPSDGDTR
jgi:hypothetical protein